MIFQLYPVCCNFRIYSKLTGINKEITKIEKDSPLMETYKCKKNQEGKKEEDWEKKT